jgi:hypothetical protein
MGSSNNAQGQNAGARQQINQQTTQAMQRLMMYLSQNPNPLQGAPAPTPPPGAPSGGGLPGTSAMGGAPGGQPRMGGMPAMPGGGQIGAPGGQQQNPQVQQLLAQLQQSQGQRPM